MEWNWSNLPETEHLTLIAHVNAKRWSEVSKLCEQYGVSTHCCCNAQGLQAWAAWAIETGIIKNDNGIEVKSMAQNDG